LGAWNLKLVGGRFPAMPTTCIEEREMTTQAPTKPHAVADPPRGYAYPTVRCLDTPTAHPVAEAWPADPIRGGAAGAPRNRTHGGRGARRPRLGVAAALAGDEANASRFAELQKRMASVEAATRAGRERALVVVPSRSIDKWHEPPAETQAYEERLLCSLLELSDPKVRMTYVTSSPIAPSIIDYYLSLLSRRIRGNARSRLTLVALGERSARPLTEKLLERPRVLERIRRSVGDGRSCHLVPYNTTSLERDVALALGIPMYGSDPRHAHFGTKSGGRALFARAGVPHPAGVEGITSAEAAIDAIVGLRAATRGLTQLVMKLNEGVSGEGNAIIDLTGLPEPGAPDEADRIAQRVATLAPEVDGVTVEAFLSKLAQSGGVIEEWITGRELQSPSVQLQITPYGEVRLLSTHDQILGGRTGQSYLGCRFPAAPSYAPAISALALRVAEHLAGAGVIGRFAIDFVVARDDDGSWRAFAIELNLRKGGTTHPYETLAHLTGGTYDPESATFTTPTGRQKHYVATDHLEASQLRGLGRDGVLALARRGELRFDRLQRTGPVFHMLSSLDELGRTGFTAIADSAQQADTLYDRVQGILLSQSEAGELSSSRTAEMGTAGFEPATSRV
jgi:PGM1 C-terminal domain